MERVARTAFLMMLLAMPAAVAADDLDPVVCAAVAEMDRSLEAMSQEDVGSKLEFVAGIPKTDEHSVRIFASRIGISSEVKDAMKQGSGEDAGLIAFVLLATMAKHHPDLIVNSEGLNSIPAEDAGAAIDFLEAALAGFHADCQASG